jgi:hypothetical protein
MKKNFAKMAPIGGIRYQIVIEIYLNPKIHFANKNELESVFQCIIQSNRIKSFTLLEKLWLKKN